MTLTLPYPPSLNSIWRHYRGHVVLSEKARVYKQTVALIALENRVKPLAGDVALTLRLYRPRRTGDADNTIKLLSDSMNGIAWADDAQVSELHIYRRDDAARPRVEMEVVRL